MAAVYPLSSYSLATIALTVASSSVTPTYIWQAAIPSGAKGKSGILQFFFNLYNSTNFFAGQSFNYGIYVDGVALSIGDTTTVPYIHTAVSAYAISSGGLSRGTNGFQGYSPIIIPVSFSSSASVIQLGITNSSLAMSSVPSASPHVTSNVTVATGTINTTNYYPVNTFTTTGTTTYTVPTTVYSSTGGSNNVVGVYIYCWGAGGQNNGNGTVGGTGGFTSGFYSCAGGTVLTAVVGAIGNTAIAYGGGGQGGGNYGSTSGGGFSGVFLSSTLSSNTTIAIAGGGGGGMYLNGNPLGNGGSGGGTTGGIGLTTSGGYIQSGYWGFSNNTQTLATQTTGNAQFVGASAINWVFAAGGGGWWGGLSTNGGSGYIGGLTSGGVTSNGVSFNASSASPSSVLPAASNSPLYVSGYGHGNAGTGLVVIIPAIGASANQIGVQANIFVV